MGRARLAVLALVLSSANPGCRPTQQVERVASPVSETATSGLSEPSQAYREMGLLAQRSPLAFVGAVRFLAGPTPDSTLALFSLSLANNALSFQRVEGRFRAAYRVEAVFRSGSSSRPVVSEQRVGVSTLAETKRADESVIFQQLILLPPGDASVNVVVRDLNQSGSSSYQQTLRIPRFESPSISSIVPSYRGEGRANRSTKPDLLVNPRATVPVASDTLNLYVEAYGTTSDNSLTLRALDEAGTEVWRSVPAMRGDSALRFAIVTLPPGSLSVGRIRVEGFLAGSPDTVRTPVLVSFSDQWIVANFQGVLNLLRYLRRDEPIQQMRTAPDSMRTALWRAFWKDIDRNPATPENETLVEYFSRLQIANARFREGNQPGWLTDRGEVFITLGEPEEVLEQGAEFQGPRSDEKRCRMNCPVATWRYTSRSLVLVFVYDSGLQRYRFDPSSRREFERVMGLNRKNADFGGR